jgi:uncharacterized protein YdeI (YjbR/CyaY-like superfamily)
VVKPSPYAIQPLSRAEWRSWLLDNHLRTEGVWLVSFKKGTGQARVEYGESVEEALCFGWIDSKPNKLDEQRSMLWFTPRKARTGWSRTNKERIERMLKAGLMHPAGLAKVEQAKADGSWTSLDAVEELHLPSDLMKALTAYPVAESIFLRSLVRSGVASWNGFTTPGRRKQGPRVLRKLHVWPIRTRGPTSGVARLCPESALAR